LGGEDPPAASGDFGYGITYKARVRLTRRSASYTFTGAGSFTHSGALAIAVVPFSESASGITLDIVFPEVSLGIARVTKTDLTGYIYAPSEGGPITTEIDTNQYSGTVTWWCPEEMRWLSDPEFEANRVYTATVVLNAKHGWTFEGLGGGTFTHNGADITAATPHLSNSNMTATITFDFMCLGSGGPLQVTAGLNLAWLRPPRYGVSPIMWFDSEEYSNDPFRLYVYWMALDFQTDVPWYGNQYGSLSVDCPYAATFVVGAMPGYTFAGLKESDFYYDSGSPAYDAQVEIIVETMGNHPDYGSDVLIATVKFPGF
jgi:hypothetical protein